ncbi:unnamed protein product, partial [Symbiodinium sp. CCMP2456]
IWGRLGAAPCRDASMLLVVWVFSVLASPSVAAERPAQGEAASLESGSSQCAGLKVELSRIQQTMQDAQGALADLDHLVSSEWASLWNLDGLGHTQGAISSVLTEEVGRLQHLLTTSQSAKDKPPPLGTALMCQLPGCYRKISEVYVFCSDDENFLVGSVAVPRGHGRCQLKAVYFAPAHAVDANGDCVLCHLTRVDFGVVAGKAYQQSRAQEKPAQAVVVADEVGDEAWAALAASYDAEDSSAIYASQGSEDPFRRVARKSQFEDMIQMLRENPGRDNTEAGEAELHGDGSPDPDANALRRSNPYEWDFTNKRKVKLTTKQLRKMFSPRQPPGIEVSSPRRTYRRWSEESDPNSEFEELSSFGGDQEDTSWIDEFLSAPARRDSWHAPASLKENQLLRVTNDDLQEACLRGDLGLVKRLINARASVNAPIRPQDADEFMTLLHVLARKPHMQNCSSIIAEMVRNKANLNVRSSFGTTPLSLACHSKHTEAVEVLLRAKASADPIDDYGKK